jgi:hypothetical protein
MANSIIDLGAGSAAEMAGVKKWLSGREANSNCRLQPEIEERKFFLFESAVTH